MESSSDQIETERIESYFKSRKCFANNDARRKEAARILVSNDICLETLYEHNYDESFLRECGFSSDNWPKSKLRTILNCLNELRIRDALLGSESLEETDATITLKVCGGITPYDVKLWKKTCEQGIDDYDKMLVKKTDRSTEHDFEFTLTKAQITDSGIYFFEIIDSKAKHVSSHDIEIYVKPNLNVRQINSLNPLEYYIYIIGSISKSLMFVFDPETHFFKLPELNTSILFPLFVSSNEKEKGWIMLQERIGVNSTTNFFHCSNVEKLIKVLEFKYICIKGRWSHLGRLEFVNTGVLKKICTLLSIDLTSSNYTASELIEILKKHARGIPTEADFSFLAKQFDNTPRGNLDDNFIMNTVTNFNRVPRNELEPCANQTDALFVKNPETVCVPDNMRTSLVKFNWANNMFRSVGLTFIIELVQCVWLYKKEGKKQVSKKHILLRLGSSVLKTGLTCGIYFAHVLRENLVQRVPHLINRILLHPNLVMVSLNIACSAIIDIFRCNYFKEPIPVGRNIIANTASIGLQAYFELLVVTASVPTWAFIGAVIGANVFLPYGVSKLLKFLFDQIDKENRIQNAKGMLGFSKDQNDISTEEINKRDKFVRGMMHPDKNTDFLGLLDEEKEFLLKKQRNTQNNLLYITYNK